MPVYVVDVEKSSACGWRARRIAFAISWVIVLWVLSGSFIFAICVILCRVVACATCSRNTDHVSVLSCHKCVRSALDVVVSHEPL